MSFSAILPKYRLVLILSLVTLFLFVLLPSDSRNAISTAASARWPTNYMPSSKDDRRIANSTLGFGAIFAMGLPDRTDKRDAMELSAALTGISLRWFDGVRGDEMNPKAVPPVHVDPHFIAMKKDAELGCWRAHMNMLQYIVKTGLSSVLILEDDADWDIHLPQQMQQFALATKDVLSQKPSPPPSPARPRIDSPYGEDWDIFWVGHCGGWPPAQDQPYSVIRGDPSVPPAFDIQDMTRHIPKGETQCAAHALRVPKANCSSPLLAPDERIVQERASPVCTVGYAVSQHGARKMLARLGGLSLIDIDAQIDTEMTEMCRTAAHFDGAGGPEKARCLIPSPAYIKPHKARGLMSGDSDIQKSKTEMSIRPVGMTKGIVWSARLNAGNLIDGYEPESQYVYDMTDPLAKKQGGWRYRRPEEYRSFSMRPKYMKNTSTSRKTTSTSRKTTSTPRKTTSASTKTTSASTKKPDATPKPAKKAGP